MLLVQENPNVPVVEHLKDLWVLSKLQQERKMQQQQQQRQQLRQQQQQQRTRQPPGAAHDRLMKHQQSRHTDKELHRLHGQPSPSQALPADHLGRSQSRRVAVVNMPEAQKQSPTFIMPQSSTIKQDSESLLSEGRARFSTQLKSMRIEQHSRQQLDFNG